MRHPERKPLYGESVRIVNEMGCRNKEHCSNLKYNKNDDCYYCELRCKGEYRECMYYKSKSLPSAFEPMNYVRVNTKEDLEKVNLIISLEYDIVNEVVEDAKMRPA